MARFELFSPFPPEECAARLRAGVLNPSSEIDGTVEVWRVELHKKVVGRNALLPRLNTTLAPEGTGTRVSGTVGIHPGVKLLAGVWFAIVGFIELVAVKNGFPLPGSLVPIAMIVFASVGLWVGRRLSRDQDRQLLEFVSTTLEAEPAAVK